MSIAGGLGLLAPLELLHDGKAETLTLGQRDHGLVALPDDEGVGAPGGELVAARILDVDNLDGTLVLLAPLDDTDATAVTATGDHHERARVVLDVVGDLVGGNVHHDGIRLVDHGVGVADGAAVVEVDAGDTLVSEALRLDLAQLVLLSSGGEAGGGWSGDCGGARVGEKHEPCRSVRF